MSKYLSACVCAGLWRIKREMRRRLLARKKEGENPDERLETVGQEGRGTRKLAESVHRRLKNENSLAYIKGAKMRTHRKRE